MAEDRDHRSIGLLGATGVGIGAIVGGGILALAGVAFATAGPSTILAFALNGVIALLTVLSFAEMASSFPESGGTYTFAKKVLSVRSAFLIGWIAWFASIMAGALYSLGFAAYVSLALSNLFPSVAAQFSGREAHLLLATLPILAYAALLCCRSGDGSQLANFGKMLLFVILILGGLWVLAGSPDGTVRSTMGPFFPSGGLGVLQAMGYTFITLQGFDLIAAVGGEVRQPERTIPRAMLLSLGAALAIYLPLLFIVITVGVPSGQSIADFSRENTQGLLAMAAQNYLGVAGFWLVIAGAVLAMLSALYANLFAASRMALAMARDRTLPHHLGFIHERRNTPTMAVIASGLPMLVLVLLLSNVAAAGAAASLIFLLTFTLVHWMAILARKRSGQRPPPFRLPWFPLIPVTGGIACALLGIFQGFVVPEAGLITGGWLVVGGLLYLTLFARRAGVVDAAAEALDPHLTRLRGRSPLVLVPVANPASAKGLVAVANALAPPGGGRALMLSVVTPDALANGRTLKDFQSVLGEILSASVGTDFLPEALTTVAPQTRKEISRVARVHRCESLLLGLGQFEAEQSATYIEQIMRTVDCDVVVLRAPQGWRLDQVKRILVPVGGHANHSKLRARLLSSLCRSGETQITYLRTIPEGVSVRFRNLAEKQVALLARDEAPRSCQQQVAENNDIAGEVCQQALEYDLVILGLQHLGRRSRRIGRVPLEIANQSDGPLILIGERGPTFGS
jgi:basic amino acid/polyamine antiporter, APA family